MARGRDKMKIPIPIKRLSVTLIAIAVFTFAFNCGSASIAEEDTASVFTGKIVKIIGEVKIQRAGEAGWTEARQGMDIGVDDEIVTGVDSSADIMFNRSNTRSKVRILGEADMSLATLDLDKVTGDSQILLELAIGHIIIKTDPLKGASKFEVLTPTSMTAVRGTAFEVIVVPEGEEGPITNGEITQ